MDYMGIDQYGETYHNLGKFPRKALLARVGPARVSKMYADDRAGRTFFVGYVIGTLWITLYTVAPVHKPV